MIRAVRRLLTLLLLFAVFPFELAVAQSTAPDPLASMFGNLWAYGGALATSGLLGLAKGLDTKLTNAPAFRKLQPIITLAGAFGAAALAAHGGPTFDPSTMASAPTATVLTIALAEGLSLLTKPKPYGGGA